MEDSFSSGDETVDEMSVPGRDSRVGFLSFLFFLFIYYYYYYFFHFGLEGESGEVGRGVVGLKLQRSWWVRRERWKRIERYWVITVSLLLPNEWFLWRVRKKWGRAYCCRWPDESYWVGGIRISCFKCGESEYIRRGRALGERWFQLGWCGVVDRGGAFAVMIFFPRVWKRGERERGRERERLFVFVSWFYFIFNCKTLTN